MPPARAVVGSRQPRCGGGGGLSVRRLLTVACFAVAALGVSSLCRGCFFAAACSSGSSGGCGGAGVLPSVSSFHSTDSGRMAGAGAGGHGADDRPEGEEGYNAGGRRRLLAAGPGSHPPRCTSKCGGCSPCYPVHVSVPPGSVVVTAEYYPVAWRCKCGDRLYMP